MSQVVLAVLALALASAVLTLFARRAERRHELRNVRERARARARGSHAARLQYPAVDLSRCIGCGACVRACPEEDVLGILHGQAVVLHGARCVGHGRCAEACPVHAIAVTLGDLSERRDIPALTDELEAVGTPGLFLAGEVTGYALIRTAIGHGTAVAGSVARRMESWRRARPNSGATDLCIVGAGPAGLACALEAKRRGLDFVVVDRDAIGGTVASYPRRKLVMTQPVDLPLHGRLRRTTYEKEELVELWQELVRANELPVWRADFTGLDPAPGGGFRVATSAGPIEAAHVCIAIGRRGNPRKLGVPGEERTKVAYSLIDAQSYAGRRTLVVGGGDSAIEAALGLAEQPGNEVTLSYRRAAFSRLKARNEKRVEAAIREGRLSALFESQVRSIDDDRVELTVGVNGSTRTLELANDDVFVMAGGEPPFPLLERCGVSLDPNDRQPAEVSVESSTGLARALTVALTATLAAIVWVVLRSDYYGLPVAERPDSPWHDALRPSGSVGLVLGVSAAALVALNLAYLVRRSTLLPLAFGTLKSWMTAHVATGVLALLAALVHGAMAPGNTTGGHALAAMAFLVTTGAIGRYLYAFVPRAANGRELEVDEAHDRIDALAGEWARTNRTFGERARERVLALASGDTWRGPLPVRLVRLLTAERRLRRELGALRREALAEDVPPADVDEVVALARRAHRAAFAAANFEDLRAVLGSWRYFHRWVALLLVLLVAIHVWTALRFGGVG